MVFLDDGWVSEGFRRSDRDAIDKVAADVQSPGNDPHENAMIKTFIRIANRPAMLLAACLIVSCSPGVDMPKGTSKGYASARLVQRDPQSGPITDATERQVHGLIQGSLSRQFTAKGLAYGKGGADLVVAYLVIYQEPGMTATYDDYFGYGRNPEEIARVAHDRGALDSGRPDFFRQAGIVIDVLDSRTNKLVYRGFAKGDVIQGATPGTRAARLDAAVASALAGFFR